MAYYLIADNKRKMPSSAYLQAEMTEAHGSQAMYPSGELVAAIPGFLGHSTNKWESSGGGEGVVCCVLPWGTAGVVLPCCVT